MVIHLPKKISLGIYSDQKLYSSVWKVKKTKNDIYLGVRNIMGMLKVSFHGDSGSRYCHVAFNDEYLDWLEDNNFETPGDKVIVSWEKPSTRKKDITHVATICFPTDCLRDSIDLPEPTKKQLLFELAPVGMAREIGFFYSFEDPISMASRHKKDFLLVGYWTLDNGEYVLMCTRNISYDSKKTPDFKGRKDSGIFFVKDIEKTIKTDGVLALVLINDPNEGQPLILTQYTGIKVKGNSPKPN